VPDDSFKETTIDGPRTKVWRLLAEECPELSSHRIARLGWDLGGPRYERVRLQPTGSFILACIEGEGRILLDGRWQRVTAGTVCMAPPRVLNAFRSVPGKKFEFVWVRYEEPPWLKPLIGAASPVRTTGGGDLARSIAGLRAEWEQARDPKVIHHWASLIHAFTSRLASPWQHGDRLWKLWDEVAKDPAAPWSLSILAARAHFSAEHLRRLCMKELGRSPMHHVTYLRMQHAQHLLETTDDKLEVVAPLVGYDSALVFSRAFKRWIGLTPSEYRTRR
jgi:AraC-like DNA-binding protein